MEKYSSRRTGWRAFARSTTAPHSNSERSAPISEERKNERAGSARAGVRDAADEPGLSDRAISVLSSRISHHHVPHGSAEAAQARSGAARGRRAAGQVRIHPHAGFD